MITVKQEKPEYETITIKLETREVAERFISIIDKAEAELTLTSEERQVVIDISNAFCEVYF